jgi:hypothetical protein
MRKTFLTVLIVMSELIAWSQDFAPLNAKWHYENFCHMPPWYGSCGYFTVEVVRDTVVNGLAATVLENRNMGVLIPETEVIIREDGDRVYFFENGQFKLLYDFNLNAGDTMTFSIPHNSMYYDFSCGGGADTSITSRVLVTSTNLTEVDGQLLKVLNTSPIYQDDADYLGWELGSVTQRVGSSNGLFGFSATQCTGGFFGHLRCYSDSQISLTTITEACDFVTGQEELKGTGTVAVYPNPASSTVRVESTDGEISAYRISNMSSQIVLDRKVAPSVTINIDLSHLPQGLYVLEAHGLNGTVTRERIVKLNGY